MNKRIIKLAEQAGLSKAQYRMDRSHNKHFDGLLSLQDNHTEQVQKFVELIVKECATIASAEGDSIGYLKDYFGVE